MIYIRHQRGRRRSSHRNTGGWGAVAGDAVSPRLRWSQTATSGNAIPVTVTSRCSRTASRTMPCLPGRQARALAHHDAGWVDPCSGGCNLITPSVRACILDTPAGGAERRHELGDGGRPRSARLRRCISPPGGWKRPSPSRLRGRPAQRDLVMPAASSHLVPNGIDTTSLPLQGRLRAYPPPTPQRRRVSVRGACRRTKRFQTVRGPSLNPAAAGQRVRLAGTGHGSVMRPDSATGEPR